MGVGCDGDPLGFGDALGNRFPQARRGTQPQRQVNRRRMPREKALSGGLWNKKFHIISIIQVFFAYIYNMDLFVFWSGLLRTSPRPTWLIESWLPELFGTDELRLIERAALESDVRSPSCRAHLALQFERLGFLLLLDQDRARDRAARLFAATEAVRAGATPHREEWPVGLSDEEKARMNGLLDSHACCGFREFDCALLIRLEQEFEPRGDECLLRVLPKHNRQPVAAFQPNDCTMFGSRWPTKEAGCEDLISLGNTALVNGWVHLHGDSFPEEKARLLRPDSCERVYGINRTLEPLNAWTPGVVRQRHEFLLNTLKSAWRLDGTNRHGRTLQ